jgi:hypothetical protein
MDWWKNSDDVDRDVLKNPAASFTVTHHAPTTFIDTPIALPKVIG